MTVSLYDLSVASFLQTVSGAKRILKKGAEYAAENDIDVDTFVGLRIHDDMLPMLYQIACVETHSLKAIRALEEGVFSPPLDLEPMDYAGMQALVDKTADSLSALDPDHVNSFSGKPILFKMGDYEMPFTAENFIMSFSIPNLSFHVTTAYDLLRAEGVPLSKADFLGRMRINKP